MYTYYWCLGLILFFAIVSNISKNKRIFWYLSYILLIFISAFRGNTVGGDLMNYLPLYREVCNMSFYDMLVPTKYGYPYIFLNKFISYLSHSEQFFLIITSIINVSLVFLFIKRYSKVLWLSVVLYITFTYYTNSFNSVRSSIALGVILLSYRYIIEQKTKKFLLLALLATSIHLSAFLVLFLYPFSKVKPKLSVVLVCVIGCFMLANILGPTIVFVSSLYNPLYEFYQSESSGRTFLFLLVTITLFGWFFNRKLQDPTISFFTSVMLYATCIQCFAPYFGLVTRCALFFHITLIILIPNVLYLSEIRKYKQITYPTLVILSFLYFKMVVMTLNDVGTNSQGTLPYEFFWNNTQSI